MNDYKKYSLEQLENWIHDAISCSKADPQEIYDVIKKTVEEEYYTCKHLTSQAYELLALLNGNGKNHIKEYKPEGTWMNNEIKESEKLSKTHDQLIAEGWSMTGDGFWIKE